MTTAEGESETVDTNSGNENIQPEYGSDGLGWQHYTVIVLWAIVSLLSSGLSGSAVAIVGQLLGSLLGAYVVVWVLTAGYRKIRS